jgi:hypothetical protein
MGSLMDSITTSWVRGLGFRRVRPVQEPEELGSGEVGWGGVGLGLGLGWGGVQS